MDNTMYLMAILIIALIIFMVKVIELRKQVKEANELRDASSLRAQNATKLANERETHLANAKVRHEQDAKEIRHWKQRAHITPNNIMDILYFELGTGVATSVKIKTEVCEHGKPTKVTATARRKVKGKWSDVEVSPRFRN